MLYDVILTKEKKMHHEMKDKLDFAHGKHIPNRS